MIFNPLYSDTAVRPSYSDVFADNTWEQIISACQANEVPDTWAADGSCYKDMEINGKAYLIQRGVDVRVPRAVAEVLENQAKARGEAATRSEQLAGEFEQRTREIFGV